MISYLQYLQEIIEQLQVKFQKTRQLLTKIKKYNTNYAKCNKSFINARNVVL
jgi:hypothetical protein